MSAFARLFNIDLPLESQVQRDVSFGQGGELIGMLDSEGSGDLIDELNGLIDRLESLVEEDPGLVEYCVTVQVDNDPVSGVEVWVTSDVGGSALVRGVQTTESDGQVTFALHPGTYYLWKDAPGRYAFTNPETITVEAPSE